MKFFLIFFGFITFSTFGQNDDLIYLRYRSTKDTINLFCVNKNQADYFIYLESTNRDIVFTPNQIKLIIKANDCMHIAKLSSKFKMDNFQESILFYKKALIGIDSAQVFKDFKTPTQTFISKNELIVFTEKTCEDCIEVTNFLNLQNLPVLKIDIKERGQLKKYEDVAEYYKLPLKKVKLPLIIFEDKPYYNLNKKETKALLERIFEKLKDKRYKNTKRRYQ